MKICQKKEEPEPSLRCLELGRAPPKPRILHRARILQNLFANWEQSRSGHGRGAFAVPLAYDQAMPRRNYYKKNDHQMKMNK